MDARDTKDRLEELRSKNRKRKLFRRKIFSGAFLLLMLVVVLGIASIFLKIINYVNDKSNEDYQNYTERRIDRLGAMNAFDNDYTNILVVGFDSTREKKVEMIFILTFENNSEKTQLLSIPNNILIHSLETPQYISDVYDIYGSDFLNHEISNLLDLTIHQYICFDISDLSDFIDVLDGIDIYVEEDMKYDDPSKSIEKGYQTLSGEETKKFLRYRGEKYGVVGQMKRQQRFLKALYEKTFQLKTILAAPYIPFLFTKDIKTNIEIFDLKYFVNCISKIYGSSPMMFVLPGYEDENNDWVPDFETIGILKDEMFNIE